MFRPSAILLTTGCTYRQLDHWINQGYVHPDQHATGKGTTRWFLGPSYTHARRVAWLAMAGLAPESADLLARGIGLPLGPGEELTIIKR